MTFPFADLELARRPERTEATGCAQFIEGRQKIHRRAAPSGSSGGDVGDVRRGRIADRPDLRSRDLRAGRRRTLTGWSSFSSNGARRSCTRSARSPTRVLPALGGPGVPADRVIEPSTGRSTSRRCPGGGSGRDGQANGTAEWRLWAETSTRGWSEFVDRPADG